LSPVVAAPELPERRRNIKAMHQASGQHILIVDPIDRLDQPGIWIGAAQLPPPTLLLLFLPLYSSLLNYLLSLLSFIQRKFACQAMWRGGESVKERQRIGRERGERGKDKERWREEWMKERQRKEGGIGGGRTDNEEGGNTKKEDGEEGKTKKNGGRSGRGGTKKEDGEEGKTKKRGSESWDEGKTKKRGSERFRGRCKEKRE
jgi:hypothetical protein